MANGEGIEVKKSIGRRLAESMAIAAFLLSCLLVIMLFPLERATEQRSVRDQVGLLAEAIAMTFAIVDEQNKNHPARTVTDQVVRAAAVDSIDILNHEGNVTFSTVRETVNQSFDIPKDQSEVMLGGENITVIHPMPWERSCVGCHDASHDPVGAIRLTVSKEATLGGIRELQVWGGVGVLLVFAILVGQILVITRRIVSRPVLRLAEVMARAESGDFMVRARIEKQDEIGALGMAFNRMLKNIISMKATEIEREADLARAQQELVLKRQLAESAEQLGTANSALEKRVRAQDVLMDAAHRLSSTLDQKALLERLLDVVVESLGHKDFLLALKHEGEDELNLEVVASSGLARHIALASDEKIDWQGGATATAVGHGNAVYISNVTEEQEWSGVETEICPENGSLLVIPLLHKGAVVAVFNFYHKNEDAYDEDEIELLQAFGAQVATALVNAELYQRTHDLSLTDPLTGLMNRRAMERRLEVELVRAQRFGLPLAILMIDVDHFKAYNDRMGHLLGDEALKSIARILQSSVRKVDAVARFGGEELCVILPRTEESAAIDVSEKLLSAVRELDLPGSKDQPLGQISISIGIGVYPTDMPPVVAGPQWESLLENADRAVYEAKNRGRDQAVTVSEALKLPVKPAIDAIGEVDTGKNLSSKVPYTNATIMEDNEGDAVD
jgi:diguanylate cyclase (GGDEF)-like protein